MRRGSGAEAVIESIPQDIPAGKGGPMKQDWITSGRKTTHYLGDAICLVAAETPEILKSGLQAFCEGGLSEVLNRCSAPLTP